MIAAAEGSDRQAVARYRLRLAAVLALGSVVIFLPAHAPYAAPEQRAALVTLYALDAAFATFALVASVTRLGVRWPDVLGVSLILLLSLTTSARLHVTPREPTLTAAVLANLMTASVLLFGWTTRRMAVVVLAVAGGFALSAALLDPAVAREGPLPFAAAVLAVGGAVAITGAWVLGRFRGSLARRQQDLIALASRLMSLQEEERGRLSRQLHDGVAQSLTAILSYLWLIERQLLVDAAAARDQTAEARRLASKTLSEIRDLSQVLRPSVPDDYGLIPSLDTYLRTFAERHRVVATLRAPDLPERLPPHVETAVYRIAQEALSNVARHAQATHVQVALVAQDGELRLDIEDDGIGIGDPARTKGLGLIGIRERVRALGGTVSILSPPGTRLSVRLPLAA
jgi:signal transduction histidine kinase